MIELTAADARRVALWRQGFLAPEVTPAVAQRAGERRQTGLVRTMVDALGAVQLDTISVLARSHELVAYSRLGAVRRSAIEAAYWDDATHFEYWSHAASILPMASWPLFAFRRREFVRRGVRWHQVSQRAVTDVVARIADDGPVNTSHVGGAKKSGYWWDWSDAKIALEYLLDVGQVACVQRVGWRRMYDLAERVVPAALRQGEDWVDDDGVLGPSDEDCLRGLVRAGAAVLGVGTTADIADVHRLPKAVVDRFAEEAGLERVRVAGWSMPAWVTPEAMAWLGTDARDRHRTTLLSPFDSLIWHRDRMERIFGMTHRLEAYTPASQRVHGYFAMPVLHQGRLVARVDPKRERTSLVASRVTFETDPRGRVPGAAVEGTARALREAASWVGSTSIRIDAVVPAAAATRLRAAVGV